MFAIWIWSFSGPQWELLVLQVIVLSNKVIIIIIIIIIIVCCQLKAIWQICLNYKQN